MKIRCKFTCIKVAKNFHNKDDFTWEYEFIAVYSGSEENKKYWKYTPSGNLKFSSMNNAEFEVGKEYYIDIILANELVEST